jgi:hypothetical protein
MIRQAKALCLFALFACCLATPAAAEVLLDCDFEDQPLDEPIGTGGAIAHQPVYVGGMPALVRACPSGGRAVEVLDYLDFGSDAIFFEFLESAEVTTGFLTITAVLYFAVAEDYDIFVREQGGAAQSFLNLRFDETGTVWHGDADDFGNTPVGSYVTATEQTVVIVFDLVAGTCAVSLNGTEIVPAESHGITTDGVGSVLFGFDHDSDLDGHYYLQSVLVNHESTATARRSFSDVKAAWD